ncbi:cysteine hydrolase family protein [Reinekea thalattae]|uniref:Cysteine hydrolase n=1 Tax=Reinekea thalattae TaxID=2593301 RepID=A0A5C8ZC62_9GAMM|nr:cysteine hydrolase family protein [Reinekea thalattae]TXR54753.1 cysteine hydrolase [Reinekea thalattae]
MPQKALIIIDVQNALCSGEYKTFNSENVISTINSLSNVARKKQLPVIFVQHQAKDGPLKEQSKGWQLAEGLIKEEDDIIVQKRFSDAFKDTDLAAQLSSLDVSELVICGMQSEFCVDSTLRHALSRGFSITVVSDAHTTLDTRVLDAKTISAHHNETWANISSYKYTPKVMSAKAIEESL